MHGGDASVIPVWSCCIHGVVSTRRHRRRTSPAVAGNAVIGPARIGWGLGRIVARDAAAVLSRMREVCLAGVRLLSDRQPARLRVDDGATGLPHVWLHDADPDTAWIMINAGDRAWVQLAYQFGHELGHVLCNSWRRDAVPKLPSQWLEEALVEAFSIRGLGLIAASWEERPPFPNDSAYAGAIRKYRQDLIDKYSGGAGKPLPRDMCAWLRRNRDALDDTGGVSVIEGPEIVKMVATLEADPANIEDLGAMNRWEARTELPLEEYLRMWAVSCGEIGTPGVLPERLGQALIIG